MAFRLNGTGTCFHGKQRLPDGSYITTEWISVFWIPLIPLQSVRVVKEGESWGGYPASGRNFSAVGAPLNIKMILKHYAWLALGIAVLVLFWNLNEESKKYR